MDANGVKVFHAAHRDHVARAITHDLKFDLFPARNVFFNQNLRDRGEQQAVRGERAQFLLVEGDAAARAAECERRARDDGVADLVCDRDRLFDGGCDVGRDDRLLELHHCLAEEQAVLSLVDGFC